MALDKPTLKSTILTMLQAGGGKSAAQAQEDFAEELTNAIDVFVRSGAVNTIVSTPDTLTGTGTGGVT
ncbi:hypothetical protein KAR91_44160 [Candidatus Pacearchaeota archaeon]|nr:hypothetical protein [Candidatus Pacearchaeota archaeon]